MPNESKPGILGVVIIKEIRNMMLNNLWLLLLVDIWLSQGPLRNTDKSLDLHKYRNVINYSCPNLNGDLCKKPLELGK